MIREPRDAAQIVKDWLKAEMAADFPELTVTLELGDWKLGDAPKLVVFDDSGPMGMWPVATSPTIRVTTWTSGRERKYANRALGLLTGKPVPGVAAILAGTSILDARDSKTRGDLASFTVRTRLRTT